MMGSLTASADESTPLSAGKRPESSSTSSSDAAADDKNNNINFLVLVIAMVLAAVVVNSILSHPIEAFALFALFGICLWKTIPTEESFDARKELKKVMRGKHLPDDHPYKPKSRTEKKALYLQTAIITGLTEAINGYNVKFESLGICKLAIVGDQTTGEVYCWAGVLGEWRFGLGQLLSGLSTQWNKVKRNIATQSQQNLV